MSSHPAAAPLDDSSALGRQLRTRHLTMMGLGSAIGAGLFLGSGVGIATAGPAILLSYAVAGLLIIFVMRMLAEMASARPASGSFSVYAEEALGPWAGFLLGWLYWFMLVAFAALAGLMLADDAARDQLLATTGLVVLILLIHLATRARRRSVAVAPTRHT